MIIQHLPITEKGNKIEINSRQNGHILDALTSVDNQEKNKIGGKVVKVYEGVIYKEKFRTSPFKKVIEKLFASGQKQKNENNGVMQLLVKLIMNSLYGEQMRKVNEEKFACKSECWMLSEYDEKVKDYWKIG